MTPMFSLPLAPVFGSWARAAAPKCSFAYQAGSPAAVRAATERDMNPRRERFPRSNMASPFLEGAREVGGTKEYHKRERVRGRIRFTLARAVGVVRATNS